MTGEEFKNKCAAIFSTQEEAARELGISKKTLHNLAKMEEVDRRTEFAINYLADKRGRDDDGKR